MGSFMFGARTGRGAFVVLLAAGFASTAGAQATFAGTNPHQKRCLEAFATPEESFVPDDVGSYEELHEWGAREYGSVEAFQSEMERRQREDAARQIKLLAPGIEAGHLPSQYLRAQYWPAERGTPGALTVPEKERAFLQLMEAGFPLAARHLWVGSKDRGFNPEYSPGYASNLDWPPEKQPPHLQAILRKAALEREEFFRVARWGAVRGNMPQWNVLASFYSVSAEEWGGGAAHRIEAYAWYELEKRSWSEKSWNVDNKYNIPAKRQRELEETLEEGRERHAAKELAERYMRVLWPRRIVLAEWRDICRLRPQFGSDPDPYGPDAEPR